MANRNYTTDELARTLNVPVDRLKLWLSDEGVQPANAATERDENLWHYSYTDDELEEMRVRLQTGV